MNVTRRQFFKVCTAGVGGSSIVLMGFSPTAALAEVRNDAFTGRIAGEICYAERKLVCLRNWLERAGHQFGDFSATVFYSDSINDLPLLESVDQPITVNPDPRLAAVAAERGWPRLEWRAAA